MHCENAIKAVVCAGYNDYLRNKSRSEIMDSLDRMRDLFEEMDELHGRKPGSSSFVVSTLVLSPALYLHWGEEVDRRKDYFTSCGRRVQKLNQQIIQFNESNGYSEDDTPLMEGIGRRSSWHHGRKRFSSQQGWFREKSKKDMLHISDKYHYVLHGKIGRTMKRIVKPSAFVAIPLSRKLVKWLLERRSQTSW